ncbi:DNA/RNA-binding protein KIN17 isoform X2 [Ischnura elegans]|uniref:DNA/RNA-binding protein KIN17 isoform X2 n=1 Tax=Ischnura elegans TaxID=197161 RepID=UPI001ED894F7|nr:DNA/RNA-binding protein KIN17 isoform X2 [Ischnura elegans]
MGKHEVGTPKYIANKIKAKGLQKLRWYCQMCQKQCRDENGFKCHMMSESHQRQLLIFADNADRYIDEFSKEFEEGYLELLSRQFGTKRVHANRVYQDYISERNHLHMNATQWETLTEFVKWLGREGKCVVDETEKGWYVQYIDRDPETIALQEALAKKEKMDKDDEEKMMHFIQKQIEEGRARTQGGSSAPTELVRDKEEPLKLNLSLKAKAADDEHKPPTTSLLLLKGRVVDGALEAGSSRQKRAVGEIGGVGVKKAKTNALDDIMLEEESKKERANRKDYWLAEGIVVKVITKTLGDKYYKKKGFISELLGKYVAMVTMLDTGHKLKLDQAHLETVIPAIGAVEGQSGGRRTVRRHQQDILP